MYLFGLFEDLAEDGRDRHHIDDAILVRVVGSFVLEHLFVVDFHNSMFYAFWRLYYLTICF
jgi:hypothetical protein